MYEQQVAGQPGLSDSSLETLNNEIRAAALRLSSSTTAPREIETSVGGERRGPFVRKSHWLVTAFNIGELPESARRLLAQIPRPDVWIYLLRGGIPVMGTPNGRTYPVPRSELSPNVIAELVAAVRSL